MPKLSSQHPHSPARKDRSAEEHGETVKAVAHHGAGVFAVCDAEDDGGEQGKDHRRAEVAEMQRHSSPAEQ
jgi:hypothetical protein